MYCSQCGEKLRDGSRFCPYCGYPVPLEEFELYEHGEDRGSTQQPEASREQPTGPTNTGQNSCETNTVKFGDQRHSSEHAAEQKKTWEEPQPREKSCTGSKKKIILGAPRDLYVYLL